MNDLISRQAAIDAIKQVFEWEVIMENDYAIKSRIFEHLRQLPSAQPEEKVLTEEDYAYCLECNHGEMCKWYPTYGCEFKDRPSAEPERKKGKWIIDHLCSTGGGTYQVLRCSECKHQEPWLMGRNFCPNCGSYNGGEQE